MTHITQGKKNRSGSRSQTLEYPGECSSKIRRGGNIMTLHLDLSLWMMLPAHPPCWGSALFLPILHRLPRFLRCTTSVETSCIPGIYRPAFSLWRPEVDQDMGERASLDVICTLGGTAPLQSTDDLETEEIQIPVTQSSYMYQ